MEAGVAVAGRSSFRKPAHAPSQRNYRRRSPSASSSRSSSSSRSPPAQASSGGWKRDRSASPSSPKRAIGTNANASLQSKKGRTSHTGKDGSDEDSQGRLAESGPGPSERQGQGRSYDRHSSKNDYHDYPRRSSGSHYDRSYHRSYGRHSNRDSYGDGRRNGDHDYVARSSRRSPERGYRDSSRNRDRERHRSRDRGRDSEGRAKYRGESRGSYLEREADVGGKIDQDYRERDRDREKDRVRDHERSRGGRNAGRDAYSSRGDDLDRRYDESRDSKRDRDTGRDQQRAYKSRRPTREGSNDRDIEAGEFDRERSRELEKFRDVGKEREREKLQLKSSVRDVSSSNHVDRKQTESSDEDKFLDNSGTNELDVHLDQETQGDTWERARDGGLKERAEEKESRAVRGPRADVDKDAERFGEKGRGRYVEPGTNRDHFDRRKERARQGDEDNTYKGRDVTGKEQFKENRLKDEDAWTESSVLRNKEDRTVQDLLSEDDEFVTGQANHTFSNRPDDGRSGTKAISASDHGSYRDKDRGSSSGLDKASASDRRAFDEITDEKELVVAKSDGQQGNKAKQVGASPSFEPKDKEGSKIRNHTKSDRENAPLVSSLPSSTASDSDKKVIAGSPGKGGKSSKWGPETSECSAEEVANDLNAAKLAAMKAAELVNKNLGVGGFMSADQKKRLLWGSKKAPAEQEPAVSAGTNRWDTVHFSDPDRQEKFHKLMGVKADTCVEPKKEGNSEVGLFTEEKQRELQQDLEKQFAAGLRRRDGGKVGLGL